MVRFSTKIRQLNEGGLINYWIEKEMDKVARISDGTDKKDKVLLYRKYISGSTTRPVKSLSLSDLQVKTSCG